MPEVMGWKNEQLLDFDNSFAYGWPSIYLLPQNFVTQTLKSRVFVQALIMTSEKLIVIDSYHGHKHEFWDCLEKRVKKAEPFNFMMLNLSKRDQMLKNCLDVTGASLEVAIQDSKSVKRLMEKVDESEYGHNKIIQFGNWTGISQGPIVSWTSNGKEFIAAGLWQQVAGSTDLSPCLVTRSGPIFESLKKHCESLINNARASGMFPLSVIGQNDAKD